MSARQDGGAGADKGPDASIPLFRKEAVYARRSRLSGEVILSQPLGIRWTVYLCALALVMGVAYASNMTWESRQTVPGTISPDGGLVELFPLLPGVVHTLYVDIGDVVREGDAIVAIVAPPIEVNGSPSTSAIVERLENEAAHLQDRILFREQGLAVSIANAGTRVENLLRQQRILEDQVVLQEKRAAQSAEFLSLGAQFMERGAITGAELRRREEAASLDEIELLRLRKELTELSETVLTIRGNLEAETFETQELIAELKQEKSEVERTLHVASLEREYVLRAPVGGTITNIGLGDGGVAALDTQIVTILPTGQTLYAKLYVPSNAAGFVEIGQSVAVKYKAFPFERYGMHHGEITSLSRSVIDPPQIPEFIADRSAPYFALEVSLPSQHFQLLDKEVPLRPGMELRGEIVYDSRNLLEWIFSLMLGYR